MQISAERGAFRGDVAGEHFWTAANALTLARIALSPLLLALPWLSGPRWSLVLGVGFLAVSLTDLLDGYLARRHAAVTRIGKLLDPLADKLLVMTALVVLTAVGRIPGWGVILVVLILGREFAVTGLRAMAAADGVIVPAAPMGKLKTGFQLAAVTGLLVHYSLLGLPFHALGLLLLVVAAALTTWSGYRYFADYLRGSLPPRDSERR
jgi:CDP-diacylglycerol--glycerol-3-phosphate 3-phosphatidyltransferase